jgi:hypothetical protein
MDNIMRRNFKPNHATNNQMQMFKTSPAARSFVK